MPTYRGITVALLSQYDALTIPELPIPPLPRSRHSVDPVTLQPYFESLREHIVEMQVPIYPGSQLWIEYSCEPPKSISQAAKPTPHGSAPSPSSPGTKNSRADQGDDSKQEKETKFYFFKLLLNGACIVRWGAYANESGKVMYGIFSSSETDPWGRRALEKGGFFFKQNAELKRLRDTGLDIQVFRSFARQRKMTYTCQRVKDVFARIDAGTNGAVEYACFFPFCFCAAFCASLLATEERAC